MSDAALDKILADLASDNDSVCSDAAASLAELEVVPEAIGQRMLRAAAESWPENEGVDPSAALVEAALRTPHNSYWEIVVDEFAGYSEDARWVVVSTLPAVGDQAAADAYLAIVERYAAQDLVPPASLEDFGRSRSVTRRLIPAVLEHVDSEDLGYSILLFTLDALENERVGSAAVEPSSDELLQLARELREKLSAQEKPTGDDWIWSDDYAYDRSYLALLLDVIGYLPGEEAGHVLEDLLSSRDPRLQYFAAKGLLHRNREVPTEVVASIAASAEMRNWLYGTLSEYDLLDRFPAEYATQEALAESNMVQWLIYPTELGRTPHEIELMATFDDEERNVRYYVFRFRTHQSHWAADTGWMAGVAGPFSSDDIPTISAGGDTFSMFTPWEEKSPREHLEAITSLIAEHWQMRAAEFEEDESLEGNSGP